LTPSALTPRVSLNRFPGASGQTPLRTPARDKLNINPEEDASSEADYSQYRQV